MLFTSNLFIPLNVKNEYFELRGKLLDGSTMLPIANAHLYWSENKTISNEMGEFSIWVKEGTLLQISHIGYDKTTYLTESDTDVPVIITLTPSSVALEEVIVKALPNEQTFKQHIITATPANHTQQELLKSNLDFIKNIHHLGYQYDMNSYDKLLSSLSDNGATVLFSSNPSMGILGLIKKLKKDVVFPPKRGSSIRNPSLCILTCVKKGLFKSTLNKRLITSINIL
ncbi:carboxypeptidase-like regulatory domain-containing protein [Cyclobacterium qasimii]|nr:carboxypeptidase-like regulatory domain-containing protein [Cyclobacterium qasimii]